MKFSPSSFYILLFCIAVFSCKKQPEGSRNKAPDKELETTPADNGEVNEPPLKKIKPLPVEQKSDKKSDRRNHKKKKTNALDTLRPKTA